MKKLVQISRMTKSEFRTAILDLETKTPGVTAQLPLSRLSKYVSERLVTRDTVPIPDCEICGACCLYPLVVPINRDESALIGNYWEVTLDDAENISVERVIPREMNDGRCTNLSGTVGERVGCEIYTNRPLVCRDFEAGSDRCHGFRRMHGIEPPLSGFEMAEALCRINERPESERIRAVEIIVEMATVSITAAPDGNLSGSQSLKLKMVAHMNEEVTVDLHAFDPREESWFEHELAGFTIDEAKAIIGQRAAG